MLSTLALYLLSLNKAKATKRVVSSSNSQSPAIKSQSHSNQPPLH